MVRRQEMQLMYYDRTGSGRIVKAEAKRRCAIFLTLVCLSGCGSDSERPIFVIDPDASGPLTLNELQINFGAGHATNLNARQRDCVLQEIASRAASAGDPETLDPAAVQFLPKENWDDLDAEGKRIILAQVITTKAFFECIRSLRNSSCEHALAFQYWE